MRTAPDAGTILETARLRLRLLTRNDLDALYRLYRDPVVRRHFPDGTRTLEQTREELAWYLDVHYAKHGFGLWGTIDRATGAFIGRCGLLPWTIDGRDEVEVAYLLDPAWWGRGLATEAARAIVAYGLVELGLPRIVCLPFPENRASIRVAEKAGLVFERVVEWEDGSSLMYSTRAGERVQGGG